MNKLTLECRNHFMAHFNNRHNLRKSRVKIALSYLSVQIKRLKKLLISFWRYFSIFVIVTTTIVVVVIIIIIIIKRLLNGAAISFHLCLKKKTISINFKGNNAMAKLEPGPTDPKSDVNITTRPPCLHILDYMGPVKCFWSKVGGGGAIFFSLRLEGVYQNCVG